MKKSNLIPPILHGHIWLMIFFSISVPLGLYLYKFGFNSMWTLSNDDSHWANFGGYIGGTVGTTLSFCAFLGLIFSIHNQRKQNCLDSILSQIYSLSTRIDNDIFSYPKLDPRKNKDSSNEESNELPLWYALHVLAKIEINKKINAPSNPENQSKNESRISAYSQLRLTEIGCDFNLLVKTWELYLSAGGSIEVINLQKLRYWNLAMTLHQANIRFRSVQNTFNIARLEELANNGSDYETIWEEVCK